MVVIAWAPTAAEYALMPDYRAYIMDRDGHISEAVNLILKDDADAIEAAKQLVNGYDVELWERDRRVAFFKSQEDITRSP